MKGLIDLERVERDNVFQGQQEVRTSAQRKMTLRQGMRCLAFLLGEEQTGKRGFCIMPLNSYRTLGWILFTYASMS